jgi:CTP synthase
MTETENILKDIANKKEETEFYTPIPKNYTPGKTKYVVTFGTVMSGLGKGIFSSSLGMLLKAKGLKVEPIKMEGYFNIDSGTLNPYRHGEVFVLDDGMETDMDLGTYERFLDMNLKKENFTTNGQIFTKVLDRERQGGYLGRDVQFIPHVTGEIKHILRTLAADSKADVILIEIGGTAGDLENSSYIEAVRELAHEEGKENVCFVALTYILEPPTLGEQKSKAAQLGIKKLMESGIQPDIIACRAENEVTEKVKEKLSIYSNVAMKRIVSMHNLPSVYLIPTLLKESGLDDQVVDLLDLKADNKAQEKKLEDWSNFVDAIRNPEKDITIGITGKYTSLRDSYASIIATLEHCGAATKSKINIKWIDTEAIEKKKITIEEELKDVAGIIVPGGFGKRGAEGKIACVQYVRENNIPYLGLCYGFQMAVVEFARNVCGLEDANTTETDPDCKNKVIDILPEQMKIEGLGGNMRLGAREVEIKEGTKAHTIYGGNVRSRFRHRFEVGPSYIKKLEDKGLVFSGKAPNHEIMQILELPNHKFFIGTQYHGEYSSRPLRPEPLYLAFVKACLE